VATERRRQPIADAGGDRHGAHALRPEQPFLGGHGVDVGARRREVDRQRPDRLGAVHDQDRPAGMGDLGDARDRHDRAGCPQHVGDRDDPRALVDRRIERGQDVEFPAVRGDVHEGDVDAGPRPQVVEVPDPARVLQAGRDCPIARPPIDRPDADAHRVGRGMGQRDVGDIGGQHRRDAGARLGHPLERLLEVGRVGAAGA
jgi:hypothetical protein